MNWFKSQTNLVVIIPIILAVASITTRFFPSSSINPGNIRAILLLFFVLAFSKNFLLNTRENIFLLVFLVYLFPLCFLSSNIGYSFYVYIKLFITSMLFPMGYYYISTPELYKKLNTVLYQSLWIIIAGTLLMMYLGIGSAAYGDEGTTFGVVGGNISKDIIVLIFITFNAYLVKAINVKRNILLYALILISIFIVFLTVKRTSMGALIIGLLAYLYFIPKNLKIFRIITVSALVILLLSPLYLPKIEERFSYREKEMSVEHFQEDDIREWRVIETDIAINAFFEKNTAYKLFGFELFNGMSFFEMPFMFHNDFAVLLAGSGLLGLFLYAIFYVSIFIRMLNMKKTPNIAQYHKAMVYVLLVVVVVFTVSGHIKEIGVRSYIMLYLGVSLAQIKYYKNHGDIN